MKHQGTVIGAALAGASLMYLLDPDRGARRRALVRDQTVHAKHRLGVNVGRAAHDLGNRARGSAAELRARWRREVVDDVILKERVRSAIGRAVSHPSAVEVAVEDGEVTLAGHVLEHELRRLLRQTRRVRGVRNVVNTLGVHDNPGAVPSLQGGRPTDRAGERLRQAEEIAEKPRPFAPRAMAAVLGGLLAARAVRTRGIGKPLQALAGVGLVASALSRSCSRSGAR